jgi:hypothetical protein
MPRRFPDPSIDRRGRHRGHGTKRPVARPGCLDALSSREASYARAY